MAVSESDEGGIPLIEDLSDSPEAQSQGTAKRKRSAEDGSTKVARKKIRSKKKPQVFDDDNLDSELGINKAISRMDNRLLADHLAQRTRRFQPNLSLVEAEDLDIPASAIRDTSGFSKDRTTNSIAEFLEQFSAPKRKKKKGPFLSDASEGPGSPHTLVVTGAGLRAADLTRALRKFQTKECMVAKLFAKHIKLKDAADSLRKTRMGIGVGTPQRVIDLLDDGALSLKDLERIVIDTSYIDQKKRGVLDMKEIQVPLVHLLARDDLKDRYGDAEAKVDLLFY